ncbi:MAG: Fic family protein, partial [Alphaproteobacteria bacterium]|nr:Fic family protein [Alphaproteobacteria bacterium]
EDAIRSLKQDLMIKAEASDLFGRLREQGSQGGQEDQGAMVSSILGSIHQTFGGQLLYPSTRERAAHLLYFVIKNHPFIDGNKRIGCLLFLLYLKAHQIPLDPITASMLVALALLVAQSQPHEKEIMIKLIMHLIPGESTLGHDTQQKS